MEIKRWQTLAAVVCSLSFQVISLAQDSESSQVDIGKREVIGTIVVDGTVSSNVDTAPKFVIGVSLSEVPESLRAHIALPDGTGVMVGSIVPDSPAAKSELQQYDILLKSGDKELKHPKDLQEIVDASEGKPVSITLQRRGEPRTVEVSPIKREELKFTPNAVVNWPAVPGNMTLFMQNGRLIPNGQLPPGMILPSSIPDQIAFPFPANNPQQIEALTESIRNLTEQVKRLQGAVDRMDKQPETNDEKPEENNRAKDEGDCQKIPRRNRLTTLISFS